MDENMTTAVEEAEEVMQEDLQTGTTQTTDAGPVKKDRKNRAKSIAILVLSVLLAASVTLNICGLVRGHGMRAAMKGGQIEQFDGQMQGGPQGQIPGGSQGQVQGGPQGQFPGHGQRGQMPGGNGGNSQGQMPGDNGSDSQGQTPGAPGQDKDQNSDNNSQDKQQDSESEDGEKQPM